MLKVILNFFSCSISAGIIDEDHMIVGVILHDNWSNVFDVQVIFYVVVAGNNNTERKFFIFTNVVFALIVSKLLLSQRCKSWEVLIFELKQLNG